MLGNRLNPEAQEFLPQSLSYETREKPPVVSIPLLPHERYQKSSPPWLYVDKFGYLPHVRFVPINLPRLISHYDAHNQPQPHCVMKPGLPFLPSGVDAVTTNDAAEGFKAVVKKFSPRGRMEIYGEKCSSVTKKIRGAAVWVPKKRESSIEVFGDCIRSTNPPPVLENGVALSGKTTVMIKNIPNQYRRHMLLEFLDDLCLELNQKNSGFESNPPFRVEYDFLYLPMDFRNHNNLGYAFVNFTCSMAATMVREELCDFKWGVFKDIRGAICRSSKVCEITWARIQGKVELVKRFRNSQFVCREMEYLPVVFSPPRDGANNGAVSFAVIGRCLPL
ncbi:hypothetical protein Vadar_011337 [Vaccinium darrowii]|uniref:Uncharacterized protein n=1 Tax=Vaccinium darrowii TaxID=229202 RepID=A0ACB7Z5L4_9ERIC|nr:hypothetical protein Vadar_011337 [Vaccinium darrowii]